MKYASAMSEHPVSAQAVGEIAGEVLEKLGPEPDLALVFLTTPHSGALEDAAGAVESILTPGLVVGCAAESVLGTRREVEGAAAVSLWAGRTGRVVPLSLTTPTGARGSDDANDADGIAPEGWPSEVPFEPTAAILIADPFSFQTEAVLSWMARKHPGLPAVGGNASGASGPRRLFVGGRPASGGAVGALLGPGAEITTVVSQGCRPIGRPLVVTRAEGPVVYELAGQPALVRLLQLVEEGLPERDIKVINSGGLHLGLVIDEHRHEFGRGDFLVRNVIGADRSNGAIAIGDEVKVGSTVQFHLRDASAADEDLRSMLSGATAEAALVFTCNGRGTRLFGSPHHDAQVLAEVVGDLPTAGFFAAGEIGPVGGRNFLHGFTASIALFR